MFRKLRKQEAIREGDGVKGRTTTIKSSIGRTRSPNGDRLDNPPIVERLILNMY